MTINANTDDRIPMSQKERDVLKIMHGVLRGERTQAQASHLLGLSSRQVRRIQRNHYFVDTDDCILCMRHIREQDHKLIAAPPANGIRAAHTVE